MRCRFVLVKRFLGHRLPDCGGTETILPAGMDASAGLGAASPGRTEVRPSVVAAGVSPGMDGISPLQPFHRAEYFQS